ncbi:putative dihydroxy-acid dehydratase [Diplocarpon rosae]|nr:putative dihydroxy-acid dehydratase [Diplocarpon rosae]
MEQLSNGSGPEQPMYINFPHLEHGTMINGKQALNKWSSTITREHDFPGAQAS